MSTVIRPDSLLTLLGACAPCFQAPSAQHFLTVVAGTEAVRPAGA